MDLDQWLGIYRRIVSDLDLSEKEDTDAARLLSRGILTEEKTADPRASLREAENVVRGSECRIFGGGIQLEKELRQLLNEEKYLQRTGVVNIAADGATSILVAGGILPDIIVSDMDGSAKDQLKCVRRGSILFLHAHGDNMDRLARILPHIEGKVIPTTQTDPSSVQGTIFNFGGFTDGDRAAHIARELGAASILLVGFDTDVPADKIEEGGRRRALTPQERRRKAAKLLWSERLLKRIDGIPVRRIGGSGSAGV